MGEQLLLHDLADLVVVRVAVQEVDRVGQDGEQRVEVVRHDHDRDVALPVLTDAVYLLDAHPHHDEIGEVVQEELLTHLYGTPVGVVRTAQGDLFTRAAWRDPVHQSENAREAGA